MGFLKTGLGKIILILKVQNIVRMYVRVCLFFEEYTNFDSIWYGVS